MQLRYSILIPGSGTGTGLYFLRYLRVAHLTRKLRFTWLQGHSISLTVGGQTTSFVPRFSPVSDQKLTLRLSGMTRCFCVMIAFFLVFLSPVWCPCLVRALCPCPNNTALFEGADLVLTQAAQLLTSASNMVEPTNCFALPLIGKYGSKISPSVFIPIVQQIMY